MTPKEEIEQLRRELEQHNYNYYVLNQPTISDFDFDQMMHKLEDLEMFYPQYADPNTHAKGGERPEPGVQGGGSQVSDAVVGEHLQRGGGA